MLFDRIAFDLPFYEGLLAGHYERGPGYGRKRPGGTDDWLLVMTLAGRGRFGGLEGDYLVEPPTLVLIPPGSTHDYGIERSSACWEILWVHFHPPTEWDDLLRWPSPRPGLRVTAPQNPTPIREAFETVVRASVSTAPRRVRLAMNALERLLLLCDAETPTVERAVDSRIGKALEAIQQKLGSDLDVRTLSEEVGLSPSRFAHLFQSEVGEPPARYILRQRLARARTLLGRTSLRVSEVATAVGMDPVGFSMRFKAEVGVSPKRYRAEVGA